MAIKFDGLEFGFSDGQYDYIVGWNPKDEEAESTNLHLTASRLAGILRTSTIQVYEENGESYVDAEKAFGHNKPERVKAVREYIRQLAQTLEAE